MSDEKSTEEQTEKIEAIVGDDALGYQGTAHGEHSGQDDANADSASVKGDGMADTLADNRPDQVK
jgi:hypothetical protein